MKLHLYLRNGSLSWFPLGKHIQIFFSFSALEQAWKWRKQSLAVPGEGRDMEGVSHRSDLIQIFSFQLNHRNAGNVCLLMFKCHQATGEVSQPTHAVFEISFNCSNLSLHDHL